MISLDEFLLLRRERPVVDVRSPLEFAEGHIPGAVNIPILNNEERIAVGTDYKQKGQAEAIRTGFRLVGPRLADIVAETEKFANGRPLLVHCWRGGMRSLNFCQFVAMAKIKAEPLSGGYKAYRQLAQETFKRPLQLIALTGLTGSGKSEILRALQAQGEQVIDLEKMAHHKGSAFGGLLMPPQPTTEQFQNELLEEILALDPARPVWVEDESIAIGKIFLPTDFWTNLSQSAVVKMDVDKAVRIQRLVHEYGPADPEEFLQTMGKIVKKLGGQHYNVAKEKLQQGDWAATIDILLTYYDKAYLNCFDKKRSRIVGSLEWDGVDAQAFAALLANTFPAQVHS